MSQDLNTVENYVDLGNKTGAVTVDYNTARWQTKWILTGNITLYDYELAPRGGSSSNDYIPSA